MPTAAVIRTAIEANGDSIMTISPAILTISAAITAIGAAVAVLFAVIMAIGTAITEIGAIKGTAIMAIGFDHGRVQHPCF